MSVRFLLGPAGSGKTWRCLAGIRELLRRDPKGPSLLLLAPKQATFQLERQLLGEPDPAGFARLHILSFERLAFWLLEQLGLPEPRLLGEAGRAMVIRLLLDKHRAALEYFGRAAGTPGFARELSRQLGNLIQNHQGPAKLEAAAAAPGLSHSLRAKLRDMALIHRRYAEWLSAGQLVDQDSLLEVARTELQRRPTGLAPFHRVWLDGFAEMTPLEIRLLAEVVGQADDSTLAFCLDPSVVAEESPASFWSVVGGSFRRCHAAIVSRTGAPAIIETMVRLPEYSRFRGHPALAALELSWGQSHLRPPQRSMAEEIQVLECQDAHEEAGAAAALIARHIAAGGRYREAAILVRQLEVYGEIFQRTLRRHEIPCFLDQRHPIRHHPLIELTRSALRLAADPRNDEDWFAWLKSGLLDLPEWTPERLENSLRAHRWEGNRWQSSRELLNPEDDTRITGSIDTFRDNLGNEPDSRTLANALRSLWKELRVEAALEEWDQNHPDMFSHRTVLRGLDAWLVELSRGFGDLKQPLRAWIPILETAWQGMTAGAIPPALDQVLIGAIDRSRNPELRLVILPGWASDLFPAPQIAEGLLSQVDLETLEGVGLPLAPGTLGRISHERFHAYIALTRSREKIVVTIPRFSVNGRPLSASSFLGSLPPSRPNPHRPRTGTSTSIDSPLEQLAPAVSLAFLGRIHVTSASALEQIATCPLQHALNRPFRIRERSELTLDARQEGTVQHELLAGFHREVIASGKQWREVGPEDGGRLLERVVSRARAVGVASPRPEDVFRMRILVEGLGRYVSAWLAFAPSWPLDPMEVELRFGSRSSVPALRLDTPSGQVLVEGLVDRIDAGAPDGKGRRPLGVVDYKPRGRTFSESELARGLHLQLPLYLLAVARQSGTVFCPSLMVYASLRSESPRLESRASAPDDRPTVSGYPHRGRLNAEWVMASGLADWKRTPFHVRFRKEGLPDLRSDVMAAGDFTRTLEAAREIAGRLGESVLSGGFRAVPAMLSGEPACRICGWRTACRTPAT